MAVDQVIGTFLMEMSISWHGDGGVLVFISSYHEMFGKRYHVQTCSQVQTAIPNAGLIQVDKSEHKIPFSYTQMPRRRC